MDLNDMVVKFNSVLSDNILLIALLGCGIFYTIYTRGVQFRKLGVAFKQVFGGMFEKNSDGGVSSFQALAVAVAAQVGTGNVAGVATAIIAGGPGAIFWMWLAAILGMSTIFAEAILAQKFRERDDEGNWVGGPAYYIKNGLGKKYPGLSKVLSHAFAILIVIALGFIGIMVQSNSISVSVAEATHIQPLFIGLVIAFFAGLIFIGGISRIARFAQMVVPFMAVLYVILSIITLFMFHDQIIPSLKLIVTSAFSPEAALGGALGITVRQAISKGVGRGLFSNEAGMGSTPHAHATANVKHPVLQGYTAMVGVFIDTIIVCSATALIILVTGAQNSGKDGALVTQHAFSTAFGQFGSATLATCLCFFAFTTIVGWYYFGETNIRFMFGRKGLLPYRALVILCIIFGSLQEVKLVWNLADLANSLMVVPNIIAIILLCRHVREMQDDIRLKERDLL